MTGYLLISTGLCLMSVAGVFCSSTPISTTTTSNLTTSVNESKYEIKFPEDERNSSTTTEISTTPEIVTERGARFYGLGERNAGWGSYVEDTVNSTETTTEELDYETTTLRREARFFGLGARNSEWDSFEVTTELPGTEGYTTEGSYHTDSTRDARFFGLGARNSAWGELATEQGETSTESSTVFGPRDARFFGLGPRNSEWESFEVSTESKSTADYETETSQYSTDSQRDARFFGLGVRNSEWESFEVTTESVSTSDYSTIDSVHRDARFFGLGPRNSEWDSFEVSTPAQETTTFLEDITSTDLTDSTTGIESGFTPSGNRVPRIDEVTTVESSTLRGNDSLDLGLLEDDIHVSEYINAVPVFSHQTHKFSDDCPVTKNSCPEWLVEKRLPRAKCFKDEDCDDLERCCFISCRLQCIELKKNKVHH